MDIGIVGTNHHASDLLLREQLTRAFKKRFPVSKTRSYDYVLLSTCNRVELYFTSSNLPATSLDILETLREELPSSFESSLYAYVGKECFRHLCRVVSSLDSEIFGETEIQRQVKEAYETHRFHMRLPSDLHYLFQKALKIGKEMRTSFAHQKGELKYLVFDLIAGKQKILFVGNSQINRQIAALCVEKGNTQLTMCTRMEKKEFKELEVRWEDWDHLTEWLSYDAVICATHHDRYIFDPTSLKQDAAGKVMIDLSIPRTVDPQLDGVRGLVLFNLEQLNRKMAKLRHVTRSELALYECKVDALVDKQHVLYSQRECSLRNALVAL